LSIRAGAKARRTGSDRAGFPPFLITPLAAFYMAVAN